MNQILRILTVVTKLKKGTFTFKIAYLRDEYEGYNKDDGDEIDHGIFNHFESFNPLKIQWSHKIKYYLLKDLNHLSSGFTKRQITLVIAPNLDDIATDLTTLDAISVNHNSFATKNCKITLMHREGLSSSDDDWQLLPTFIEIAISRENYLQIAESVFPY